ncbi:MAG: hypothetical protein JOZ04_13200 [Acidimicrobiia bacterium]|nr:hypothetical protein [Acidimicrobiia bacterium]
MELRDYFDILKRRKKILIAVPLIAFLLVAGLILIKPKQYQATATVAAPALVGGASANQYSGANGPKAFVANFTAAVTAPPVVDQVSQETGVPKTRVKSGVSASEIGTSSLMQVAYSTPKKKEAFNVAQAAASDTIVYLFKTQVPGPAARRLRQAGARRRRGPDRRPREVERPHRSRQGLRGAGPGHRQPPERPGAGPGQRPGVDRRPPADPDRPDEGRAGRHRTPGAAVHRPAHPEGRRRHPAQPGPAGAAAGSESAPGGQPQARREREQDAPRLGEG